MVNLISSLVLITLLGGFLMRRHRKFHVPLMIIAFVADLSLVMYVELQLHAVERVLAGVSPLILFHALISTGVLLLYVTMAVLGVKLLKNPLKVRVWHSWCAVAFVTFRLLNYGTSWLV